jgi:transcriptional regulator with XRE-family HTH domain
MSGTKSTKTAPFQDLNRWALLRYERGLTLTEVADGSGVSTSTLKRLESDDKRPNAPTAKALADFYGLSITELLADPDPETKAAA